MAAALTFHNTTDAKAWLKCARRKLGRMTPEYRIKLKLIRGRRGAAVDVRDAGSISPAAADRYVELLYRRGCDYGR